jgi:hypothetical protein
MNQQKQRFIKASIFLFLLCGILLGTSLIIDKTYANNDEWQIAYYRPLATGYAKGTMVVTTLTEWYSEPFTREQNVESQILKGDLFQIGDISYYYNITMTIRWAVPQLLGFMFNAPPFILYYSQNNGSTWNFIYEYTWTQYIETTEQWGAGFTSGVAHYYIPSQFTQYFMPNTIFRIQVHPTIPVYTYYLCNYYWGAIQKPIPPNDFIDESGNYVQYVISFTYEYQNQPQEYKGSTIDFPFDKTKKILSDSADMILNTMHLSGASNEVVGKQFGTDTWIIIYSSQLAMMKLTDLLKIFPENATNYLVPIKRFIVWMWNKQNLTDGSFPFILTDGDQHRWYNATTNQWYGYDKIDSFSASAISLMRKYYDATEDLAFINKYWNPIFKSKEFIVDLMNLTYWLPVDGYHFNGTHYIKSQMNWLHDCVEAYQGIKDYAYLEGVRGNSSEQTYWNNYAESIANGIRTYFWNETLGRYAGMFYINNGTQNTVRVYNTITPLIYNVEINGTRASSTISQYVSWGILSGRYYEKKWAEDYSISNEYSTMSGMILSSFAKLITQFNYTELWMKDKFFEVSKFLFMNPIYPNGNLQNNAGWLDFVNLVNYTWAQDYARLIETSAWIIDGFMYLPNMVSLYNYTSLEMVALNQSLTLEGSYWNGKQNEFKSETGFQWNATKPNFEQWVNWLKNKQLYVQWFDFIFKKWLFDEGYFGDFPWWEEWTPIPPPIWIDDWVTPFIIEWSLIGMYTTLGIGLSGVFLMCFAPSWVAWKIKKKGVDTDTIERFGYALLLFLVGFGLFIMWLWS